MSVPEHALPGNRRSLEMCSRSACRPVPRSRPLAGHKEEQCPHTRVSRPCLLPAWCSEGNVKWVPTLESVLGPLGGCPPLWLGAGQPVLSGQETHSFLVVYSGAQGSWWSMLSLQGQIWYHLTPSISAATQTAPQRQSRLERLKAGAGHSPEPGLVDTGACQQPRFKDCKGSRLPLVLCPTQKQKESNWKVGAILGHGLVQPGGHRSKLGAAHKSQDESEGIPSPDHLICPVTEHREQDSNKSRHGAFLLETG